MEAESSPLIMEGFTFNKPHAKCRQVETACRSWHLFFILF